MKRRGWITALYSGIQGSFWMSFCVCISFAAVYLQWLGYSNTELGLILAAGNLSGAWLGPYLSSLIDRFERFSAGRMIPLLLAAQTASLALLAVCPFKGAAASVGFVLYIAFCIAVNSLNLKLYVDAAYGGLSVNYGISRGVGSLAFVLLSLALGIAAERLGAGILPYVGMFLSGLQLLAHFLFCKRVTDVGPGRGGTQQGASLSKFLLTNRRFCVLLLGIALLFCAHNIVFNFLINVTDHVGGTTATMGIINGFMAAVEIPVMIVFSRLFGKRSIGGILRISFVFFTLKSAAIAAASSVPLLFAAILLQAPSFALYTAAIVPYVDRVIPHRDSAKAQSLVFSMTQVGAVLSSLVGGVLYDNLSVTATLWIACAICAAGTLIASAGITRSAG